MDTMKQISYKLESIESMKRSMIMIENDKTMSYTEKQEKLQFGRLYIRVTQTETCLMMQDYLESLDKVG